MRPCSSHLPAALAYGLMGLLALSAVPAHAQLFLIPGAADIRNYTSPGGLIMPMVAWGDFNGDGIMEPFATGRVERGANSILISRMYRGAFAPSDPGVPPDYDLIVAAANTFTPLWLGAAAFGDLDNDGDLDLVTAGASRPQAPLVPRLIVYINSSGTTGFSWSEQFYDGFYNGDLALGDLDNDGDLDLVMTGFGDDGAPFARTLINDGAGGFSQGQDLMSVGYSTLALADYDGDFDLDLVLAGVGADQQMRTLLYHNNDGTLVDAQAGLPGLGFGAADWGDFDSDGDPDLLLMGAFGLGPKLIEAEAMVFRNDGGSLVATRPPGLEGLFYGTAMWQDVDGDGDLDVAATGGIEAFGGRGANVSLNQGDGSFLRQGIVASNPSNPMGTMVVPGLHFSTIGWGDYDYNGALDMILLGESLNQGGYSALVAGNGKPEFGATPNVRPTPPTNLQVTAQVDGTVVLGWDASLDPDTPTPMLTYNVRVGTVSGADNVVPAMALSSLQPERHELRTLSAPGNAGQNLGWKLKLPPGTYFWSVQACDTRYYCSPFSTEASFVQP